MKNFISFTFVKVIIYYLLYTFTFCTVIQSSPFGILVSYLWNSCTSNLCPCFLFSQGFPGGASRKEPAFQCRRTEEMQVLSLGWEDPLEKEMQPTPVFLPGESHGQRSLVSYSP